MFKPEYIQDNYNLFGWVDACELLYNQLRRMGKSPRIAQLIATGLMRATIR